MLEKQKSNAFGKDVYLLGIINGKYQWLEAPKWDCGWYWGFGYVEEYTSHKDPYNSNDIRSHMHMDGLIINGHSWEKFEETAFNDKEAWQLAELFKQFYLLREMAAFCHKELPGCHITTSPVNHGDMKSLYKNINEEMIPKITAKIIEILDQK